MTRYFYLLFLLLSGLSTAFAQNNYVISRSYKAATQTATSGATFWGTSQQVTSSVQYFDKLGKPRQEVSVYGSNTPAKDLVVTKGYNNRHQLVTVTPPATNSSGSSGGFAGSVDLGFYTTGAGKVVAPVESNRLDLVSTRFFYEDSPLGRVRYTSPVGLTATAASTYKVNTAGDNVKRYKVSDTGLPVTTDNYAAGELTFVNNVDEAGKVSQEFKDYRGQTVLRRATHPQGNLDTYYVYDAKGQLRFVLQPEYQVSADVGLYAFRYEYDFRGNMIKKKVPGANEVVMTYDGRDRMSTMTDGKNQSFSYEYEDNLNRLKTVKFKGPGMGAYQDVLKYYYDTYPSDRRLLTYKNDVFPEWSSAAGTYYLPSNGLDKARQGYQVAADARVVNSDGTLSDTWLLTLNVYDDRYQIIQIVRHLYGVGNEAYERISYLRDFEGKVIREQTDQGSSSWAYHLQKEFTYDHMSRPIKTTHKVWEANLAPVTYTHSEITYNEIGTPKTKKLHNGMHEVAIKPHVRGWLGAVNQTTGKTFSLGLEYEVNGNVKTVNWGTNGYSGGMSASYDEVNRLKETTGWGSFSGHSEKVDEYDRNGNIKKLSRYKSGALIDNLTIGHRGNQMQTISDAGSNTEGYKQQPGTSGEVIYDNNGNMVEDPGRKLKLDYNLINLARKVNINGNDRLKYVYDASGVKLNLDAAGTNTYYAGAFEYSGSGNLKRIAVEEGQIIRNSTNNFTVQYYLRDHLGNVRMVLDQNGNVVQETEYYAFGMTVDRTTGSNQYLYNGKEKQPETDFFDFGARQYDPILGRWMSVDPIAEKYISFTPFNYNFNNPLSFVDPNGMGPDDPLTHTVSRGETLTSISRRYGVSVADLASLNKLKNADRIAAGSILKVNPEMDFSNNPLGGYQNPNNSKGRVVSMNDVYNVGWGFAAGAGDENMVISGGEALKSVRLWSKVANLFSQGMDKIGEDNKFTPGETFSGNYSVGGLIPYMIKAAKMKEEAGGPVNPIGSFGFSMRVNADGKSITVAVYDSKTLSSFSDHILGDSKNVNRDKSKPGNQPFTTQYFRFIWTRDLK